MSAVGVFLRAPVMGQVKTRLARTVGDAKACALYRAFIADTLAKLADYDATLWVAGEPAAVARDFPQYRHRSQADGGLGERLEAALDWQLGGSERAIIVSTDSPSLPHAHLAAAFTALRSHDLVFGPATDGGYYLVGVRRAEAGKAARWPRIFHDIPWSGPEVLRRSLRAARDAKLSVALLPPWFDVDDAMDLRLLATQLRLQPDLAPHAALTMGLSRAKNAAGAQAAQNTAPML